MRTTGRVAVVLGLAVATLLFVSTPAYSQNFSDLDAAENVFEDFATGVAGALPLNSSIGLNWSSAHIGQVVGFPPRFGLGLTMGATTLPYSALGSAVDDLGADLGGVPFAEVLGLPIPGYTVDGRIGGFILPFDIGLKIGGIPANTSIPVPGLGSVEMDYLLVGGDFRYRVVEENAVLPTVSVGVGFNHLRGKIGVEGVLGDVEIASVEFGGESATVVLEDPALEFEWESNVIDFKVQASKDILVLTPYLGLGASYAWSEAGGGVRTSLGVRDVTGGISEADAQAAIESEYDQFDSDGFGVSSSVQGFGVRTFGGFSFNVLIARLDFTLMYDFLGQNIGATTGARIQL